MQVATESESEGMAQPPLSNTSRREVDGLPKMGKDRGLAV